MSSSTSSKPHRLPGKFGPAIDFSKVPAISKLGKQNRSKWYIPHEPQEEAHYKREHEELATKMARDMLERAIDEGHINDDPNDPTA